MEPNHNNSALFKTEVGKMILSRLRIEMEAAEGDDQKMDDVVRRFYAAQGWLTENN